MPHLARTWAIDSKRAIPKDVQNALRARIERHAGEKWADSCRKVDMRFRGGFAYVDAFPKEVQVPHGASAADRAAYEATRTHLFRLKYLGSPNNWEYSFFCYSSESYKLSVCASGSFEATPEQAFDSAAGVYL
jgi:hypothetical protein